ncbi:MAG: aryl-sulfate sulfotransferase [Myxococcota bacterium]
MPVPRALLLLACACRADPAAEVVLPRADAVTVRPDVANVLLRRFDVALAPAADAELRCTAPTEPLEDHRLAIPGGRATVALLGLLPRTRYRCTVVDAAGAERWRGAFTTDPLPDGLPTLAASGDRDRAVTDDAYVLFTTWALGRDAGPKRAIVVDGDGRVRWYLDLDDASTGGIAAHLVDGLLVTGGGRGSRPALRTLEGELRYQVPPPAEPDGEGYHHEAQLTPEGWLLSLQAVRNEGPQGGFAGFRIEAWDPATDALTWSFDSQPQVDAGVLPPGGPGDYDPFHANAVTVVDDDPDGPAVWVSLRGLGSLMRIDRATGAVTGFFGPDRGYALEHVDGTAADEAEWFWGQHAPEIVGDTFTVYDNGGRRPGSRRYSRVARYRRLGDDRAVLLWDWTEPGWYETNFGSVAAVPDSDGHVLVGTGHCGDCDPDGDTSWVAELDPRSGEVVWRLDFTSDGHSLYRAQPLGGCEVFANRRTCP